MVNNVKYNSVRYFLYHLSIGQIEIEEPIGWNDDDLEYARNDTYSGVFTLFSNNLEFYGEAKDAIESVYQNYGEEAKISLKKQILNDEKWETEYEGDLDFNTYVFGFKKSTCKFNSSGLSARFKTQEEIEVEIEREDSLDGDAITPITINEFDIQKRDILILNQSVLNGTQVLDNDTYEQTPLTSVVSSQNDDFSDVNDPLFSANVNNFFWNQNSEATTELRIDITLEANSLRLPNEGSHNTPFFSSFEVHRYNWNGASYDFVEKVFVGEIDSSGNYTTITNSFNMTLNLNDSLAFKYINDNAFATIRGLNLDVSDITEYTINSKRNFVFIHDLLNSVATMISGRDNKFKSNYFGSTDLGYSQDGDGYLTGFTSGKWIRKFDSRSELYSSPKISWKDAVSSLNAVFNIGFGIHKEGVKEIAVIEDKKYFFQDHLVYSLPNQVVNFGRNTDPDMLFSELEFGYSKSGGYEEEMGIDEPNIKTNYSTFIKNNKKKYSKISKVRTDSYGKEFARRKSQRDFPTEDTKYDDSNWFIDIKDNTTSFSEKLWEDRFEEEPKGIYSPETLTGAYYSPANNLLRHSWYFSSGFEKNLDKYVRFANSNGNSNLSTKLIGGSDIKENGTILNYNLERARILPSVYKFTHVVDKTVKDLLKGNTTINGVEIPNIYCLWEFYGEDNVLKKGFIKSVKPNSNEWELIPFNEQTRKGNGTALQISSEAIVNTSSFLSASIVDANVNVAPIIGELSYVTGGATIVIVSWTAATDSNLDGYYVYYKLSSVIDWTLFSTEASGATSVAVTGLTGNVSYDFSIVAFDSGAPVLESERSNVITRLTDDDVSPVIGVLSKGVQTETTFPLTWTAATDNVGVVGYVVLYKLSSSGTWIGIDTLSTDLFYTVNGLTNGSSYDFKITAYDLANNVSSDSNIITDSTVGLGIVWYSSAASNSNSTDTDACFDVQINTFWHIESSLSIGDYIYSTSSLSSPLSGGDYWYKIGLKVFRVDDFGEITEEYNCIS